jgi:hypothetical protein
MVNKLIKKLLLKSGETLRVLNGPRNLLTVLGDLPPDNEITEGEDDACRVLLIFAKDSGELESAMRRIVPKLRPDTVVWIAYPKKDSGIPTDLNLMTPWQQLQIHGLGPVASIAIDTVWTGIRLKRIEQIKPSGLCNDDIAKGPYGAFIDVERRVVRATPDLQAALNAEPTAKNFFESLSYTNRKEYVLWLLTAKQEKTRLARLEETVKKLLEGKKNPTEK